MDFAAAQKADTIPVVDISALMQRGETRGAAEAIHRAAREVGFFYLAGHGIPQARIDRAFTVARDFFDEPEQLKASVAVNTDQRGWMATGMSKMQGAATHDLKEVFFWGAPDSPPANQWPADFPRLYDDLMPYYEAVCSVGRNVLRAVAVGFDLPENVFEPAYRQPMARGQLVYYPPSTEGDEAEQRFGVAPHTDFGVLTFLLQDSNGGLQVRTHSGDWIEAPPIPGTLVCNIGDLLQRWTNDRFVSTVHRVINRSGLKRHSIPIFFDPNANALIDPRDLGSTAEDVLHAPVTAGAHIASRNRKSFAQYKSE